MRTNRLLQLLQILRRYRHPVSGQKLADELGISIRTLYRDIATLQAEGAEIEGEAGVGYLLKPGFFLPPLMLSQNEIESLILGMRWVSNFGDLSLASSATEALAKIKAILPPDLCDGLETVPLRVGPPPTEEFQSENLSGLRDAIRREKKLKIVYVDSEGSESTRVIWPFAVGYFPEGRILAAWCETRRDYRHFLTSRIKTSKKLPETYPRRRSQLFEKWQRVQVNRLSL